MGKQICLIMKVTTRCNLKCSYCYEEKEIHEMDDYVAQETISKALNEFDKVQFCWHGGEPLTRGIKFFERAIEYQQKFKTKDKRVYNTLQTNALLLSPKLIDNFNKLGYRIGVSCDGPSCHDIYRLKKDGSASYKEVLENINLLKDNREKFGTLAVVTPEMINRQENILQEFTEGMNVKVIDFLRCRWVDGQVSSEQYYKFMNCVFNQWIELDDPSVRIRSINSIIDYFVKGKSRLCRYLGECHRFLTIRPNGDVFPCESLHSSSVYQKLGNVLNNNFDQLFSRACLTVKQSELKQECEKCEFVDLCRGACLESEDKTSNCHEKKLFFKQIYDLVNGVRQKSYK